MTPWKWWISSGFLRSRTRRETPRLDRRASNIDPARTRARHAIRAWTTDREDAHTRGTAPPRQR